MSQLYRMSKLLAGISVEHGLDGLYQIALYERRHVVLSGKCNNDLERILSRDAVEQYTRGGVREDPRIGPGESDPRRQIRKRALEG